MPSMRFRPFLLAFCLATDFASGFSFGGLTPRSAASNSAARRSPFLAYRPSTWLAAEATPEGEQPAPGATAEEATTTPAEQNKAPSPSSSTGDASDILNSPVFLKRKLEVLQNDLAKAESDLQEAQARTEAGKAEWGNQLDELQKEYQNIQERMNSQSQKGDSMATIQVVRQMLGVLDNFDRAFGAVQPQTDEERAIESEYKSAYTAILDTFKKLGVEEVETVGVEFDYEVHQAVMQKPSDEFDEGVVCEELQKGFKLGDQLVRAAMVVVAA